MFGNVMVKGTGRKEAFSDYFQSDTCPVQTWWGPWRGWRWGRRASVPLRCPLPARCAAGGDSWGTRWHNVAKAAADKTSQKRICPWFILVTHWGGCWRFRWSWPSWNMWLFIDIYISEGKQCSPLRKHKIKPPLFLCRVPSCCNWDCTL